MTKWQFALIILFGVIIAVAVGLLIAASVQGMTIIEMFSSWVETKPVTPPEEVVEPTKLFVNLLRI